MPASTSRAQDAARFLGQLARVVDVQRHVGRLAGRLERADELGRDPVRLDHRHAGVHADDLHMRHRRQRLDDLAEPPRRQHQRIAAGEDDLPDFGMRADVVERRVELGARERGPAPDHLAAEAEPAIDRADVDRLEQHAIGIAVHDALDRAVGVVADRIGALLRPRVELGRVRHELARDRIVRIGRIDELDDLRGERQRIAGGDPFELGPAVRRGEPGCDQVVGAAERLAGWSHGRNPAARARRRADGRGFRWMVRRRPNVNRHPLPMLERGAILPRAETRAARLAGRRNSVLAAPRSRSGAGCHRSAMGRT